MNRKIYCLMLTIATGLISTGCSQTQVTNSQQPATQTSNSQQNGGDNDRDASLKWLGYADPKADAYLAIEKKDFNLLAFAGRATSFPSLENQDIDIYPQQCGYKFLPNSGDALTSQSELNLRKRLFQYAAIYNRLVLNACKKSL
jgi:hypothetical protein